MLTYRRRFLAVLVAMMVCVASANATDDERRAALRSKAQSLFNASPNNHCQAFAQLADYAAKTSPTVGAFLEDMRLVVVGADWLRRHDRRGAHYMGEITNDTGFKDELRDGSPQVEHLMAAIYLGKSLPPGAADLAEHFVEFVTSGARGTVNSADHLLYALGSDLGARLYSGNLTSVKNPISRTICK